MRIPPSSTLYEYCQICGGKDLLDNCDNCEKGVINLPLVELSQKFIDDLHSSRRKDFSEDKQKALGQLRIFSTLHSEGRLHEDLSGV